MSDVAETFRQNILKCKEVAKKFPGEKRKIIHWLLCLQNYEVGRVVSSQSFPPGKEGFLKSLSTNLLNQPANEVALCRTSDCVDVILDLAKEKRALGRTLLKKELKELLEALEKPSNVSTAQYKDASISIPLYWPEASFCKLIGPPPIIPELVPSSKWIYSTHDEGEPVWAVHISPPGSLSNLHQMGSLETCYIFQVYGHQIWLTWPVTPQNLEILYGTFPEFDSYSLLSKLEGMTAYYLSPGDAFTLSNPISLRLCLTASMYLATDYVHRENLDISLQNLTTTLKFFVTREKSGDDEEEERIKGHLKSFMDYSMRALKLWDRLDHLGEEKRA